MRHARGLIVGGAVLVVAAAGEARAAAAPTLRTSTSVEHSSGRYGGDGKFAVTSVSSMIGVNMQDWFVRASLPYLQVKGPAWPVVIGDGGPEAGAGAGGEVRTERGIGDLALFAGRGFSRIGGRPIYGAVSGRVKLPTGSRARGLGTGSTDAALIGELGVADGRRGVYFSGSRRFLGDAAGFRRRDGWQAGGGGWVMLTGSTFAGGGLDWREAAVRTAADPAEIYAYVGHDLDRRWRLQLGARLGLSDGSPAYGLSGTVVWRQSRPVR